MSEASPPAANTRLRKKRIGSIGPAFASPG